MENIKREKGTSDNAIAIKRLKGKQLNLIFNPLSYDELKRIRKAVETALISKKDEQRKALLKQIEELDRD
jgi:hypothetical protein